MRRTVLLVLLLLLVAGTADATVRVLPLGDSLTKGSTQTPQEASHPTYRYWLWQQLRGQDVDFVGSWTAPNFPYDFDQGNEGHGGYMTAGILYGVKADPGQGRLSQWLGGYEFDVALVMLGTNDVLNNIPTDESVRNLEGIVGELRTRNPRAVILLAQIPPTSISRPNLNALNAAIPGVASHLSTSDSPIVIVDMYSGYDGATENQPPTGIHPAESGEKKIAARWYAALQPFLPGAPTPVVTATPTPTPVSTVTYTPVTPAATAPNVVRSPGATVYTGERGLDIAAAGVGAGETLGWFDTQAPEGDPAATLRIEDPHRAAIPHGARPGRWYNLDRNRSLALVVEEPAISLRLVDTATGRYVTGGEVPQGRRFNLEISGVLSAFAARGSGAPVAIRVRNPAGQVSATLVGDGGARRSLDRVLVAQTPFLIRGTDGAAWNTADTAYTGGEYELWAEALLDHEHRTANPDPTGAVGRQVSVSVRLQVSVPPTVATATSLPATTVATAATTVRPTTPPGVTSTAPAATTVAVTTTTAPPPVTTAVPTLPAEETSWWFPYFLVALAAVFLIAGGGIWWALRAPGRVDARSPRPAEKRAGSRALPIDPSAPPAIQIALDRIRGYDPVHGDVRSLEAALRALEQAEQARLGRREVDLLTVIPPARIPTIPIPDAIRRWAERVGFVPLSLDRHGSVLFYSPVPHQGGTHLVVKRADELVGRLDGEGRGAR